MNRGMDHSHYRYAADPQRSRRRWPNGARTAVWVVIYLESMELDPPHDALADPRFRGEFGNLYPDYRAYSLNEYGNRVGVFRILQTLCALGIRATVAVNALTARTRPALVDACLQAGHTPCAHGHSMSRMVSSRMSADEEATLIALSCAAVEAVSGIAPAGWISQDFGQSSRSPGLLAAQGIRWIGDWPNDDQPYLMTTVPPMVSIPAHVEWDDAHVMESRKLTPWAWHDIAREAFDVLHSEGGRIYGLGLHPRTIGHPHRIGYLERMLEHLARSDSIWWATGDEIATHVQRSSTGTPPEPVGDQP